MDSPNKKLHPLIGSMVDRIVERFHPNRIVLFGSHARGDAGRDSDVDLLIVMPLAQSKRRTTIEMYGVLAGIGMPKDVIVVTPEEVETYRNIPGTIIYPALKDGITLYERN